MSDSLLPASDEQSTPYKVLARKYRPANFDDLIGQAPMVKTLDNAFKSNRIAQAWLLTGVRGIGKTTTARILARALNYETEMVKAPTLDIQTLGFHCQAIMESRHIDVIEMDAASNTGINDIREIIESARFRPAYARYKVFIIDEVHMLSTAAFNGLLKTLEEPPPHVKFIFATTELRKVPVTILSRCQRFDLRRIEPAVLENHLAGILQKEHLEAETEALSMIVKAAEGSVRDSLSLLDQAIAHSGGKLDSGSIRDMLGLSDKSRIHDLFNALAGGEIVKALAVLKEQYDLGVDPQNLLVSLAEITHELTKQKVVKQADSSPFIKENAEKLSLKSLSRLWQMLNKGIEEVKAHPRPFIASEMVLIRICYAADLPLPEDVVKQSLETPQQPRAPLNSPRGGGGGGATALAYQEQVAPVQNRPQTLADISALASLNRDLTFKMAIDTSIRLVSLKDNKLDIALTPEAPPTLANELQRKLTEWTKELWLVSVSKSSESLTIEETQNAQRQKRDADVRAHPMVKATLEHFAKAEIIAIRPRVEPKIQIDFTQEGLAAVEEEED